MPSVLGKHGSRILLYGIGGAVAAWILLFGPKAQQTRNMKRAEQHILTKITPLLQNDPRFDGVVLKPYTEHLGSIVVTGTIANYADITELRGMINATTPPVPVIWRIGP
jgi:hypothetical protein